MIPEETQLNYLLRSLNSSGFEVSGFSGVSRVSGGSINDTYRLTSAETELILKVNSLSRYPDMFDLEKEGLDALRRSNSFRIPDVFLVDQLEDEAFLVMEYITEGTKGKHFWQKFGQQLAALHRNSNEQFGHSHDNYIGSLHQSNSRTTEWVSFFIEQRLEPQLRLAGKLLSSADYSSFDKLFHRLDKLIPIESPALLHGDLWGGNYLADDKSQPVLIDPAIYYGHREVDLAMMHLFGGFNPEVFECYHREFPLEGEWRDRLDLHNLYPLLVHVNLFGDSYLKAVRSNLRRYL